MLWATVLGVPFLFVIGGLRRKQVMMLMLLLALAGTIALVGCGGGAKHPGGGTPSTYTVNVIASIPQTTVVKTIGTVTVTVNH